MRKLEATYFDALLAVKTAKRVAQLIVYTISFYISIFLEFLETWKAWGWVS